MYSCTPVSNSDQRNVIFCEAKWSEGAMFPLSPVPVHPYRVFLIVAECFLSCLGAEHPGSQSQGEDSCPHHVNSKQEEGEEKMEEKPRPELWCKIHSRRPTNITLQTCSLVLVAHYKTPLFLFYIFFFTLFSSYTILFLHSFQSFLSSLFSLV